MAQTLPHVPCGWGGGGPQAESGKSKGTRQHWLGRTGQGPQVAKTQPGYTDQHRRSEKSNEERVL